MSPDLSKFSLWDLFRGEVETHSKTLTAGLLALEERPGDLDRIKALMRAAHSIKGAARVVQHSLAVDVAHAMEDRLVAAQSGARPLGADDLQRLLEGVDLLQRLSPASEADREPVITTARPDAERFVETFRADAAKPEALAAPPSSSTPTAPVAAVASSPAGSQPAEASSGASPVEARTVPPPASVASAAPASRSSAAGAADAGDRSLRLTAQTLTRVMGLAGEAVVATRWLEPFVSGLASTKRRLADLSALLDRVEGALEQVGLPDRVAEALNEAQSSLERTRAEVTERIASVEQYLIRQESLVTRLYGEVLATRMRPFGDLVEGYPRLVRDLARQLGKKVRLHVDGEKTGVDRDLAELLDAPLNHVVRNAVDHGIEPPADRVAAGKPEVALLRMSAWHRSGMLVVEVADDGRGVDLDHVRQKVVERGLTDAATVARLSEQELLEFLFLPGFTTAARVTDVSGRGVGLDVVLEAMKAAGGRARLTNRPGNGLVVAFELPVTLSVLRVLVVEVAGEPYAFPLTRLERVVRARPDELRTIEGRQYITTAARDVAPATEGPGGGDRPTHHVGLATARQILGVTGEVPGDADVAVVIARQGDRSYGIVVDRIVGEETVVVRPLDPRLGKVQGVSAAALAFDGTPLLLFDADDLIRGVEQILATGTLARVGAGPASGGPRRKRILVVDDSITVREVERQTLEAHGYAVEVAVDGMDGWNAVRTGQYDLMVTDVDMPRMDGIELVRRVRADQRYRALPIIIVSYKDREEDRLAGLDAGASYYLPKAAFQDESFVRAVDELIGSAEA